MLLGVLAVFVILSPGGVILWPYGLMLGGHLVAYATLQSGRLRTAIAVHATLYIATVLVVMLHYGGLRSPAGLVLPPIVLLVGLTWNGRAALVVAAICSFAIIAMVVLERRGALGPPISPSSLAVGVVATAVLVITSVLLALASRSIGRAQARALAAEKVRISLQERLQRTERLETTARLAAGVAHDFNNLLNVIIGHAEMLGRSDQPKVAAGAQRIEEAAWRAADLTRKLLAVGRRQNFELADLDLNEVVRGIEPLLRQSLPRPEALTIELATGRLALRADATSLEQILFNLVSNAGDATAAGGRIRMRTGRSSAAELAGLPAWRPEAGAAVLLEVSDTGEGMTPEVLEHVFEPFFTTKEPGRGTGLGLPSVYGIVQQSGGVIVVDSVQGWGSTFRVYLPAADG